LHTPDSKLREQEGQIVEIHIAVAIEIAVQVGRVARQTKVREQVSEILQIDDAVEIQVGEAWDVDGRNDIEVIDRDDVAGVVIAGRAAAAEETKAVGPGERIRSAAEVESVQISRHVADHLAAVQRDDGESGDGIGGQKLDAKREVIPAV